MSLFRISRPVVVDARQCGEAGTIASDLGFINVKRGDWIIRGEDGETYILNDEFFQRTFSPLRQRQGDPQKQASPNQNLAGLTEDNPRQFPLNKEHRRARRPERAAHKRRLRMH